MASGHKRKFGEYCHDDKCSSNSQDYEGVGQLLKELKGTSAHQPSLATEQKPSLDDLPSGNGSLSNDARNWQIVDRKQRRKPRRKRAGDEKDRIKYPQLTCHGQITMPIRIADLQALTLYTLADGLAPNWVAFKHVHHTKKVVVLMVPGLEDGMFDGSISIDNDPGLGLNQDSQRNSQTEGPGNGAERREDRSYAWDSRGTTRFHGERNPTSMTVESLPPAVQPLAKIFEDFWQVKAPGDSRYSKLHSPIQAMLISPLPQSKENKVIKGPKPPAEEKGWQPQRTPITKFIHTVDELREADYPLHPTIFQGDIEAALLEEERRDKTSQNAKAGWVDSFVSSYSDRNIPSTSIQKGSITAGRTVYAVDCEMVLTSDDKYSLARISVVDWSGQTMLDELVKPSLPIKNYFTQFSGITSVLLDPVKTTLSEIQSKLLDLFTPQTILLGHSLESDLTAMRLTHPFIIDTSLIYPHPRGPPLRSSLKFLAQKYLRRDIQQQDKKGHDSVEDALAVLDLVKMKCEKGAKWGTSEASGEPIFRRLARKTRKDSGGTERAISSAMVDYGTPERGYGKEATVQIGCESDEEVVRAITRAVNGDVDGKVVPGGGVDFTWARLRELESFRGWCNNNREYAIVDRLHGESPSQASLPQVEGKREQDSDSSPQKESDADAAHNFDMAEDDPRTSQENQSPPSYRTAPNLHSTISSTVSRIQAIHDSLPPCTLFIVYSGTGDPREVGRLQKMQQQFRKEFKVKKWDDLTIKWTDDEEQALRTATERAREGMGFMCVK